MPRHCAVATLPRTSSATSTSASSSKPKTWMLSSTLTNTVMSEPLSLCLAPYCSPASPQAWHQTAACYHLISSAHWPFLSPWSPRLPSSPLISSSCSAAWSTRERHTQSFPPPVSEFLLRNCLPRLLFCAGKLTWISNRSKINWFLLQTMLIPG